MNALKGPSVRLVSIPGDTPEFRTLKDLATWASAMGFEAIEMPCHYRHIFDVTQAAVSLDYCDEICGVLLEHGLRISQLSVRTESQLIAVHSLYEKTYDKHAPESVRGIASARRSWAEKTIKEALAATAHLNLTDLVTYSGSMVWPLAYPLMPFNKELHNSALKVLGEIWSPLLKAAELYGVNLCFEICEDDDLNSGESFERFLESVNEHPRCCLQYNPLSRYLKDNSLIFSERWHDRIRGICISHQNSSIEAHSSENTDALKQRETLKDVIHHLKEREFSGWLVLDDVAGFSDPETAAREGCQFIKTLL